MIMVPLTRSKARGRGVSCHKVPTAGQRVTAGMCGLFPELQAWETLETALEQVAEEKAAHKELSGGLKTLPGTCW